MSRIANSIRSECLIRSRACVTRLSRPFVHAIDECVGTCEHRARRSPAFPSRAHTDMSSIYVTFILRLIHVLTAIFWVGGITVVARFLMPSGRDLGSIATPVMTHLMQVRKLPVALLVAGWLTV